MKPIIEIEGLTKVFKLGNTHGSYLTLRDTIKQWLTPVSHNNEKHYIKALDDVTFSVQPGEKIGVIGKNGAGKSTLLKILSRITPPSQGKAILRGRVASLLEVGTGFHGELTGRENIFLNGAILGMKRNEIKNKLDEIVAFSGVERFLDTPLKHYSSGMQVRLAFAVAAHLDADVLLVDEVLAVGDAEFQKKSLGVMNDIAHSGRTIFFVSHNMLAINDLCNRVVLFENGRNVKDGKNQDVINSYFLLNKKETEDFVVNDDRACHFVSLKLNDKNQNEKNDFFFDENIILDLNFRINVPLENLMLAVALANNYNQRISVFFNEISNFDKGLWNAKIIIPDSIISPGIFHFNLFLYIPGERIIHKIERAVQFNIFSNNVPFSRFYDEDYGEFITNTCWSFEKS